MLSFNLLLTVIINNKGFILTMFPSNFLCSSFLFHGTAFSTVRKYQNSVKLCGLVCSIAHEFNKNTHFLALEKKNEDKPEKCSRGEGSLFQDMFSAK